MTDESPKQPIDLDIWRSAQAAIDAHGSPAAAGAWALDRANVLQAGGDDDGAVALRRVADAIADLEAPKGQA